MLLKASEAFNGSHSVSLCYVRSVLLFFHCRVFAADLLFSKLILTLLMLT